jgi:hypothetical protein
MNILIDKYYHLKIACYWPRMEPTYIHINSGSIMHQEWSNLSRCKHFLKFFTLKEGLHLKPFHPSRHMIDTELRWIYVGVNIIIEINVVYHFGLLHCWNQCNYLISLNRFHYIIIEINAPYCFTLCHGRNHCNKWWNQCKGTKMKVIYLNQCNQHWN